MITVWNDLAMNYPFANNWPITLLKVGMRIYPLYLHVRTLLSVLVAIISKEFLPLLSLLLGRDMLWSHPKCPLWSISDLPQAKAPLQSVCLCIYACIGNTCNYTCDQRTLKQALQTGNPLLSSDTKCYRVEIALQEKVLL